MEQNFYLAAPRELRLYLDHTSALMIEDVRHRAHDEIGDHLRKRTRAPTGVLISCATIKARHAAPTTFNPATLERSGRAMRENITAGDIPFRKAWMRSIIERI